MKHLAAIHRSAHGDSAPLARHVAEGAKAVECDCLIPGSPAALLSELRA